MKYIFCDTSALMQSPEGVNNLLKKEEATALVCSVVLDELDKHKDGSDTERKYKARQAIKLLNKLEEEDRVIIAVKEDAILPNNFDMRVPDNKILACLKAMKDILKTIDIDLLTYDNGMKIKAKLLGMPTIVIEDEEEEAYKGYVDIYGNEEEVYAQICDFEDHKTLRQNQYVIVHQRENENEEYDVYALRYNGKELVDTIDPKKSKCPVKTMSKREMDRLADGLHQGIILTIPDYKYKSLDEVLAMAPQFLVLLDHLEDPHNLGAIIRTCEAAGVDAIVMPKDRQVQVNGTVMKTSAGTLDNVNIVSVTNLANTIDELKDAGFWIVGTTLLDSVDYRSVDYSSKIALVIGNEGSGMSRLVSKKCDYLVKIPMYGKTNSLNASVASGIMIYEVVRNRK